MKLRRDSSKRLIAALEVEAARYGRLVTQVADRFGLEPLGPQVRGLDAVFQEFGRGDLHVSLDWDNWMGFQVVAKSTESEALVEMIAGFLPTAEPSD